MRGFLVVFLAALAALLWIATDREWHVDPSTLAPPKHVYVVNASKVHTLSIPPDPNLHVQVPVTLYMTDGTCWRYEGGKWGHL